MDDLVKRLRDYRIGCGIHCSDYSNREPLEECLEAAERLEQMERERSLFLEQMERERSLFLELIAQYNVLMDNYELQPDNHSKKALKDFLERFPSIPNYDSKGNWVGNVRNENGWTA